MQTGTAPAVPVFQQMAKTKDNSRNRNYIISLKAKGEMLSCFEKGFGYKRTATETGLTRYQVRYYHRRFASGDTAWAYKPSRDER